MNYTRRNIDRLRRSYGLRGIRRKRRMSRLGLTFAILIWIAILGLAIIGVNAMQGAYQSLVDEAPDISNINVTPTGYATFVYDNQGNQTAKMVSTDSNRIPVTMDMVPENLQHAFVAIEDERFYDHHGIDIQGIVRAAVRGITSGSFDEGASTITQQLIKNSVFTNFTSETFSESVRRKIQEQYLAVQLERKMSKDDILLNYLNIINLWHNTLGVQAASQRYFGKSVSTLSLSECAVIAGITQNPTKFDPITYPENNARRRKVVLGNMLDQGWISQEEYNEALADDVYARIQATDLSTDDDRVNSYFVDALTDQVLKDLVKKGYTETQASTLLYSGGLHIYSTQDHRIQAICDAEANNPDNYPAGTKWYLNYQLSVEGTDGTVSNYSTESMLAWMKQWNLGRNMLFSDQDKAKEMAAQYKHDILVAGGKEIGENITLVPQPQISLTIEDQRTGDVLAIVGGRGDKTANRTLNRATSTLRQPGSTFKVVSTYAAALDAGGKTLATGYMDEPYAYADGTPVRNWYGEAYRGWSTIREGIQDSMNILAVKTLTDITPQLGYEYLQKFGFTTLVEREVINNQVFSDIQQTLALGGVTKGVENIELNAAYAAIANGGTYLEPKLYSKITDHDGNVILDASARVSRQVLRPATAWLLTSAMEDVVNKGTGKMCRISQTPVAGKTGTTSDENDVWFAGYSNYYTCTTWAGYDENTDLYGSEANIAKLLWQKVMEQVHENMAYSEFVMPDSITQDTICSKSGLKAVPGLCDSYAVTDYFDKETFPTDDCNESYHQADIAAAREAEAERLLEEAERAAGGMDVASAQAAVDAAQGTLDQVNQNLQIAQDTLGQTQAAVAAAQASGDLATLDAAMAANNTASGNYNAALQQQAEAQQALDAARAALDQARAAEAEAAAQAQAEAPAGAQNPPEGGTPAPPPDAGAAPPAQPEVQ